MVAIRKLTTSALVGSGAFVTTFYGLLLGQGLLARHVIGTSDARPPLPDSEFGADLPGEPIACLIVGDSAAVGYGMTTLNATPPGLVGLGLTHLLDCPVTVTSVAVVGARTSDLDEQVTRGLLAMPQVALIVVGANDVVNRVRIGQSARQLEAVVRRLVDANCEVVVGTCPDLGTVRPLRQPLRSVARAYSRRLAAAQAVATLHGGGRTVSLGGLLGPVFASQSEVMFGEDHFHPSEAGYGHLVSVVLPSIAAALHERAIDSAYEPPVHPQSPRQMLPIDEAATQAAQHAGTELVQTGRWATLRRRRGA